MKKVTSDIYFASALIAMGAKLVHVDRQDPRHMKFEFESKDTITYNANILNVMANVGDTPVKAGYELDLDKIETDWANGDVQGNFTKFADALKQMKSVVHTSG